MVLTTATYFFLKNNTRSKIIRTEVPGSSFDGYDFYGKSRPDKNLVGRSIGVGGCICVRLELRDGAKLCPFTMELTFKDGSEDEFTINQKWAFKDNIRRLDTHNSYHKIRLERYAEKKNSLLVTIEHTPAQLNQLEAVDLLNRARSLMQQKLYQQALAAYEKAYRLAQEQDTKSRAWGGISNAKLKIANQRANELNKQAEQLIARNNCEEAIKKCREALTYAKEKQTIDNINKNHKKAERKLSEQLIKEAINLINQGQFDAAIKKLDRVMNMQKLGEMPNIRQTAMEELSRAWTEKGIDAYTKAWSLEQDETKYDANEVRKLFGEAKTSLQSKRIFKRSPKADEYLEKVTKIIEAYTDFNDGVDFEIVGFQQFKHARDNGKFDDHLTAEKTYLEALKKFIESKKKFNEGVDLGESNCKRCSDFVFKAIETVRDVLDNYAKIKLNFAINNLRLNTKSCRYNNIHVTKADVLTMFSQIMD